MLLISFSKVLMFLIAFLSLKQAKNEGELGIIHGKVRLKLNYIKNPSFGELQTLCQINQVCKEESQRRNLTLMNFTRQKKISQPLFTTFEIFTTSFLLAKISHLLFTTCEIFTTPFALAKISHLPFSITKISQLHFLLTKSSCNL